MQIYNSLAWMNEQHLIDNDMIFFGQSSNLVSIMLHKCKIHLLSYIIESTLLHSLTFLGITDQPTIYIQSSIECINYF